MVPPDPAIHVDDTLWPAPDSMWDPPPEIEVTLEGEGIDVLVGRR
jgi:hypothetical protein